MRRLLLLIGLLSLLLSCASSPDATEEPAEEAPVSAPPEAPATRDDEQDSVVESDELEEPVEVTPRAETSDPDAGPDPITLTLVNPADPTTVTRSRFLLSVLPSRGRIARLEVELLSGQYAPEASRPFALVAIEELPLEQRLYEFPGAADPLTVTVPAGFVNGEMYELRVRGVTDTGESTEWLELSPRLALDLKTPAVAGPEPTLDTSPEVRVDAERPFELYVDGTWSGVYPPGAPVELALLNPGTYRLAARTMSEDGYLTRLGPSTPITIRADGSPVPSWPTDGLETLTSVPGLQWREAEGAVGYQARYRLIGSDLWSQSEPVTGPRAAISDPLQQGAEYEWQVRAQNDSGTWFSWSDPALFTVGDLSFDFVGIIGTGQMASLSRGYESGSRDEGPVREITLTRPFEMAQTPITNGELARLVEYGRSIGFVEIDDDGVWTVEEERRALVGLGEMDYGEQFGLEYAEGRVIAFPARVRHPAVGVTWLGAVQIANLLSYVEGLDPAYDSDGYLLPGNPNGYRLPTEAEWEFAARGTTRRLLPWDGSLSGRVSNYYRSFDPFEDVSEPFTGSGGPTNPVGFFDGTAQNGFQTASDASPFGVNDMVGNVWEWCYDRYGPAYYESSPDTDPVGPAEEEAAAGNSAIVLAVALDPDQRVVRGSAWNTREPDVRLTNRGRYTQLGRSYSIGVRLVRSPRQ